LQRITRSVPIVFANVIDPVGAGFVASLARPGGNTTGFSAFEYSLSGKWLEVLKEIAPSVNRAIQGTQRRQRDRRPSSTATIASHGACASPARGHEACGSAGDAVRPGARPGTKRSPRNNADLIRPRRSGQKSAGVRVEGPVAGHRGKVVNPRLIPSGLPASPITRHSSWSVDFAPCVKEDKTSHRSTSTAGAAWFHGNAVRHWTGKSQASAHSAKLVRSSVQANRLGRF
jgi:ABC transporter substrate binding protein